MKNHYDDDIVDRINAEYVVLQTTNMNLGNKSGALKLDSLAVLLEESDSVTNFRRFLDSINSGYFLDFWFACQGFKNFDKSDSHKLNQLMKVIYKAYIKSESPFAVPLKSNTKKTIVDKLSDRKIFDPTIFDTAQSEIRDILAGEFLNKFYKSEFYTDATLCDKASLSSVNYNSQLNEVPVSSCSSTDYISRRNTSAKNLVTSHSSDALTESDINNRHQNDTMNVLQSAGAVTSTFNNMGINIAGSSVKDRRNLSEVDPPAFAKVLSNKLEELFVEQTNMDRLLRLMKSSGTNESDTDDSHSSALSYLMKCQLYTANGQTGHCCSIVDGDLDSSIAGNKMRSQRYPGDIRDDYAQGILESHCSRIGLDHQDEARRHGRRDLSESRVKAGSTTSYDSGCVATSLDQHSGISLSHAAPPPGSNQHHLILQMYKNGNQIDSSRYHHHHHHHHHKNAHVDYPLQPDFLTVNNVSDVSSNLDSGVSSTYENLSRRFYPTDDKVSKWMSKNAKLPSKSSYKFGNNEPFPPTVPCSGIPQHTSRISSPSSDSYPSFMSPILTAANSRPMNAPFPPGLSIETWLSQQHKVGPLPSIRESRYQDYCSSTVGVAGSELVMRDDLCPRIAGLGPVLAPQPLTKDQHTSSNSQSQKPQKLSGPLVIGYYIGNDPVPYRTQVPDAQYITLGQFKNLIAKKGPFRYFFKRYCDEFDCGVVHEEITKDDTILPLWEGKVVAKIEKSD